MNNTAIADILTELTALKVRLDSKALPGSSTGPRTPQGKQRSSLNAFCHGLSSLNMILLPGEHASYEKLTAALHKELKPGAEMERQMVQKIIDTQTRLNRIAVIETNILNTSLVGSETDAPHEDALETLMAQCRAWIKNDGSFEKLGRYEARLSRQLIMYTKEFERLKTNRIAEEKLALSAPAEETKSVTFEDSSFRQPPASYVMSAIDCTSNDPVSPQMEAA